VSEQNRSGVVSKVFSSLQQKSRTSVGTSQWFLYCPKELYTCQIDGTKATRRGERTKNEKKKKKKKKKKTGSSAEKKEKQVSTTSRRLIEERKEATTLASPPEVGFYELCGHELLARGLYTEVRARVGERKREESPRSVWSSAR